MKGSPKVEVPTRLVLAVGFTLWVISIYIGAFHRVLVERNLENISPYLVGLPFPILILSIAWFARVDSKYSLNGMQKWSLLAPVILLLCFELPRSIFHMVTIAVESAKSEQISGGDRW